MTASALAEPKGDAPPGRADTDSIARLMAEARAGLIVFATGLVGSRQAAEDVVHDVFEAVLRTSTGFDNAESPLGYLRAAVVNRCRSLHRRAFVRRRWEQRQNLGELFASCGAEERARAAELMTALRELNVRQREVILLRYWCDLSFPEIARLLDIPSATVRSVASRAVHALAHLLEAPDA